MQRGLRIVLVTSGTDSLVPSLLQALDSCELVDRTYVVGADRGPASGSLESVIFVDAARVIGTALSARMVLRSGASGPLVICDDILRFPSCWLYAWWCRGRIALIVRERAGHGGGFLTRWLLRSVDSFIACSVEAAVEFCRWSHVPAERGFLLVDSDPIAGAGDRFDRRPRPYPQLSDWLWGATCSDDRR